MPRLTSEAFGGGDQSWLGSSHSIANCRTETLDISAFNKATHYPDGYIPSGTPALAPQSGSDSTKCGKLIADVAESVHGRIQRW